MAAVFWAGLIHKVSPAIGYFLIVGLLVWQHQNSVQLLARGVRLGARRYKLLVMAKVAVAILAFLAVFEASLLTFGQYVVWKDGPPGIYFLPPHQPLSYFAGYAWQHFAKAPAFLLVFAGAVAAVIALTNFLFRGRFFYEEEPYLAAAAILASRWPNAMLAIGGTIVLALLAQIGRLILRKSIPTPHSLPLTPYSLPPTPYTLPPTPLKYFWLPCALAAMVWGDKIASVIGLSQFRF